MKKSWKQWMAITCALAMIVSLLPVTILAEEGVATPTDLAPVVEPVQEAEPAEEEKVAYTARIAAAQRDGKIYLTVVVEPEYTGTVIWEKRTPGEDEEKWIRIEANDATLIIVPGSNLIGKEIRFRLEDGTTPILNYVVPELEPVEESEEVPAEGNDEPVVEINQEEAIEENETDPAAGEAAEEPVTEEEQDIEDYETPLGLDDVIAIEPETQEETVEEPTGEETIVEQTEEEIVVEETEEIPAGEEAEAADDDLEIEIIEESVSQETDSVVNMNSVKAEVEIPAVIYTYERDENGDLVLDENGNPIVTVAEGYEIPVSYLHDENGELVLDENGDPIPTQTVPADAVIVNTLEDALNPDRTIDIYYSWNNETPALDGEVVFIAVMNGYDNLEYTIQWQQSKDAVNWFDIVGATGTRHMDTITRENYKDFWRVQVSITGVLGEE